jgi:hypothetical protein
MKNTINQKLSKYANKTIEIPDMFLFEFFEEEHPELEEYFYKIIPYGKEIKQRRNNWENNIKEKYSETEIKTFKTLYENTFNKKWKNINKSKHIQKIDDYITGEGNGKENIFEHHNASNKEEEQIMLEVINGCNSEYMFIEYMNYLQDYYSPTLKKYIRMMHYLAQKHDVWF